MFKIVSLFSILNGLLFCLMGCFPKTPVKVKEWFDVDAMNPPLKDGESIFDMGVGVGAPFEVLL